MIKEAFERDRVQSLKLGRSRWFGPLAESVAATLATALLFGYLGGFAGLIVYSALVVLMLVSMQWTVYLQHWGLNESPSLERQSVFGWEDTCQAQAWITLGLSIHDSHHQNSSTAFYRLTPNLHAPRPPAGYVVLMLASLFPPLWRRLMLPALRHWEAHPQSPIVIGRRLVCLNLASLNPEQLGSVDATLQPKPASPIVPTRR